MQQFNKFSESITPSTYANRLLADQLSFSYTLFVGLTQSAENRI